MRGPAAPSEFTAEQVLEYRLLWSSPVSAAWTRAVDRRAVRWLAQARTNRRTTAAQRAQRRRLEVQLWLFAPSAEVEALIAEQDQLARRATARHAVEGPVADRVEGDEDEGVQV